MNEARLWQELLRDEGLRLDAYQDSVGLWTIGIGHLLGTQKRMTRLTVGEAAVLFAADVEEATQTARNLVPMLPFVGDARARALVNMAFNLGGRLGQFKMFLASVDAGNWEAAGVQMMASKWASQVGPRASRLRTMIVTGNEAE